MPRIEQRTGDAVQVVAHGLALRFGGMELRPEFPEAREAADGERLDTRIFEGSNAGLLQGRQAVGIDACRG